MPERKTQEKLARIVPRALRVSVERSSGVESWERGGSSPPGGMFAVFRFQTRCCVKGGDGDGHLANC